MDKQFLFETSRCRVRFLQMNDLEPFHEMQSNPRVMQYVRGKGMTREENEKELPDLIEKYDNKNNDFWIYAIEKKSNQEFIGTCAFVKDDMGDDELGYRFLEKYWGLGYGLEICSGLIAYGEKMGLPYLVGYVVNENKASAKILEKCGFQIVGQGIDPKLKLPETKYRLVL